MNGSFRLGLLLSLALLAGCPSSGKGGGDDDGTPTPCVAETDPQFCSRLSRTCEAVTGPDNCGTSRTAECGTCTGTNACVANVCQAPACADLAFAAGLVVADVSTEAEQDAVIGTTPDGGTLLYQRRAVCIDPFALLIADRLGIVYQEIDISAAPGLSGMAIIDGDTLGLSAEGLSIVGVNVARTAFLMSTRSARGLSDFSVAASGPFAGIVATGTQQLGLPALSADGLAFYYVVYGDGSATVNGIYESVRPTTADPFPAGTRMPAPVQDYTYVTGASSDRMALFVETGFAVSVLTRTSLLQPFVNPNAPAAAPTVPGFRTRPLEDCSALVGTCTVGGCPGEEICSYPAVSAFSFQPRPVLAPKITTAVCPASP